MNRLLDRHMRKKFIYTIVPKLIFLSYITVLVWRLFFYAYGNYYRFGSSSFKYHLVPFKTISRFLFNYHKYSFDIWFYNLPGNILAFMPMGFLLPIIYPHAKSTRKVVLLTFLTSLCAELLQLLSRLGEFDVDDLILNSFGGFLGFILYQLMVTLTKALRIKKGG